MKPLALSDAELAAVMAAARPLAPRLRDAFVRDVASVLAREPMIGDGIVVRVCQEVQRRYFDPPMLDAPRGNLVVSLALEKHLFLNAARRRPVVSLCGKKPCDINERHNPF